ncbi:MAG: response regulator [Streptosporangiaceae bacterium]
MSERHILLVEDNPDDEALTIRAFRKNNIGNRIVVAHDGAEAIDHLLVIDSGDAPPPRLILLDLKLPKVDGVEVLRRIRTTERTRLIPVVVLSTSIEEKDVRACYDGGANAYLRKPVNFAAFIEAIDLIGRFWLLLAEPPPDGAALRQASDAPQAAAP